MRKWLYLIMFMMAIMVVEAGFFVPSEGASSSGTGLWSTIRNWFTFEDCVPNWVQGTSGCLINDTQILLYTDSNSCGGGSPPADNGTFSDYCNYCSYDLDITFNTTCVFNNATQQYEANATVYDKNFAQCCNITGLDTDCYNDDSPGSTRTYYETLACAEELNMWQVAIAIIMVGILGIFFFIASNWKFALFARKSGEDNQSNVIKVLLVWLGFWLIMPLIQLMVEFAEYNNAPADIITLLETVYTADLYINLVISAYFVIFFVYNILLYLGVDIVPKNRK